MIQNLMRSAVNFVMEHLTAAVVSMDSESIRACLLLCCGHVELGHKFGNLPQGWLHLTPTNPF